MQSVKRQTIWETAITLLRFPLMVAVVFIHTSLKGADSEVYTSIRRLFSTIICGQLAVPMFFFISGFLFFYKINFFSYEVYLSKIKKRIRTLFIPYLFWNFAVLSAFWCAHTFLSAYISPDFNNVPNYSWLEVIRAFWDRPGVYPICYQFWFLRNLMVYCILSPFVFWAVKYGVRYIAWLFILIPFIWNEFFFYFCIGAYFSIREMNVDFFLRKYQWIFIPLCMVSFLVQCFVESTIWMHLFIWSGMATISFIACYLVKKGKSIPKALSETTFWIYAVHGLPIVVITTMILPKVFNLQNDLVCILLYLFAPIVLIVLSVALYHLLKKIVPTFLYYVTGSRI